MYGVRLAYSCLSGPSHLRNLGLGMGMGVGIFVPLPCPPFCMLPFFDNRQQMEIARKCTMNRTFILSACTVHVQVLVQVLVGIVAGTVVAPVHSRDCQRGGGT